MIGALRVPHEDLTRGIGRVGQLASGRGGPLRKSNLHSAEVTGGSAEHCWAVDWTDPLPCAMMSLPPPLMLIDRYLYAYL